jgi:D-alanyl-D-alanine carboxypeptidase (penicillin-binding protein 5/6)
MTAVLRMVSAWLVATTVAGTIVGVTSRPASAVNLATHDRDGYHAVVQAAQSGNGPKGRPGSGPGGIRAPEAAIADARDGDILWGRDQDGERQVASITKVMTALVVLRSGGLDREVAIPDAVSWYVRVNDASSAGLRTGDRLSAGQLLYALLLPSGADAAYALAQAYGPGLPAFVARMNAMARQLSMRHTRFTNFDGLPYPAAHPGYSTAADLIVLGRAAMTWRTFRHVVGDRAYQVRSGTGRGSYYWRNPNPLIGGLGVEGIKGGWTTAAGECLLFEASRGGASLIGVVLGEPSLGYVVRDANRMLDWGFAHLPGPRRQKSPPPPPVPPVLPAASTPVPATPVPATPPATPPQSQSASPGIPA